MKIVDIQGKYELEIERNGQIVYETVNDTDRGLWTIADFTRLHNDYVNKIYPLVKGKAWTKCSDIRKYKTSLIVPAMTEHLAWAGKSGMGKGCIITDSAINKMQIERGAGGKGSPLCPVVFITKEEARDWLHKEGYKG